MGEHKLREANGDGETPKALSTHIVEVAIGLIDGKRREQDLCESIEQAYARLSERATRENSLILGVVQAVSTYTLGEYPWALVTLTAQRISREDFERQQRMARFGGDIGQGGRLK